MISSLIRGIDSLFRDIGTILNFKTLGHGIQISEGTQDHNIGLLSVIKTFGTCDPVSNGRIWLI